MAVKVSKVIDKHSREIISTSKCSQGYEGEFVCASEGCNAPMSFVKAYEQRRLEKTIFVPSYFKLKKNHEHVYGVCPYNTYGTVEVIARDSDKNIIKALDNGKYELSLQILHKADEQSHKQKESTNSQLLISSKQNKTAIYTKKGTASSYIKALNQILTLRAKLENDDDLSSVLTLNYRSKKIDWKDFYFETNCYKLAFKIANAENITPYPMCLHGAISKIIDPTDKFRYPKIKVTSPYIELESEITDVPSLEMPIADETIKLNNFKAGDEILIYGLVKTKVSEKPWTPYDERENKTPKKIRFLSMTIWVNHKEQILKL